MPKEGTTHIRISTKLGRPEALAQPRIKASASRRARENILENCGSNILCRSSGERGREGQPGDQRKERRGREEGWVGE